MTGVEFSSAVIIAIFSMCCFGVVYLAYLHGKDRAWKEYDKSLAWFAEQYKDYCDATRWIPCEERLPELRKDVLVTVKSDDGYISRTILARAESHTHNMRWESETESYRWTVLAWMECPPAYTGEGVRK